MLALLTRRPAWRALALANIRVGAALAVPTAIAGWALASGSFVEPSRLLTWHGWVGLSGAMAAVGAALASLRHDAERRGPALAYQAMLFAAATLIGVAGHLGGVLVWGPDFLLPR
jgi:hypothetical protein